MEIPRYIKQKVIQYSSSSNRNENVQKYRKTIIIRKHFTDPLLRLVEIIVIFSPQCSYVKLKIYWRITTGTWPTKLLSTRHQVTGKKWHFAMRYIISFIFCVSVIWGNGVLKTIQYFINGSVALVFHYQECTFACSCLKWLFENENCD